MKTYIIFTIAIFISSFCFGQQKDRDYYQLHKGGEKHLKPIRYLLLNENDEKIYGTTTGKIFFNIDGETFKHNCNNYEIDTIALQEYKKLNLSNIKQLKKDEYSEHLKAISTENINMPPPPNHYNLKIYVVEKNCNKKVIKYEVDWIYSIH